MVRNFLKWTEPSRHHIYFFEFLIQFQNILEHYIDQTTGEVHIVGLHFCYILLLWYLKILLAVISYLDRLAETQYWHFLTFLNWIKITFLKLFFPVKTLVTKKQTLLQQRRVSQFLLHHHITMYANYLFPWHSSYWLAN